MAILDYIYTRTLDSARIISLRVWSELTTNVVRRSGVSARQV